MSTTFAEDFLYDLHVEDAERTIEFRAYEDENNIMQTSTISLIIDKRADRSSPPQSQYDDDYEGDFYQPEFDDSYYGYLIDSYQGKNYSMFLEVFDIIKHIISDPLYDNRVIFNEWIQSPCVVWTIPEKDHPEIFNQLQLLFEEIIEKGKEKV